MRSHVVQKKMRDNTASKHRCRSDALSENMGETVCCPSHPEENSNISCPLCEALFGQAVPWPTAEEAAARIDYLDGMLSNTTKASDADLSSDHEAKNPEVSDDDAMNTALDLTHVPFAADAFDNTSLDTCYVLCLFGKAHGETHPRHTRCHTIWMFTHKTTPSRLLRSLEVLSLE